MTGIRNSLEILKNTLVSVIFTTMIEKFIIWMVGQIFEGFFFGIGLAIGYTFMDYLKGKFRRGPVPTN